MKGENPKPNLKSRANRAPRTEWRKFASSEEKLLELMSVQSLSLLPNQALNSVHQLVTDTRSPGWSTMDCRFWTIPSRAGKSWELKGPV